MRFGGIMVASLAGVVGMKYLIGTALALLESRGDIGEMLSTSQEPLLTGGSVLGTAIAAVLLLLVTGLIVTGTGYARGLAIGTFLVVIALGIPSLVITDPISVVETAAMLVAITYLLRRRPIRREARSAVDAETSGTRVGSTLR